MLMRCFKILCILLIAGTLHAQESIYDLSEESRVRLNSSMRKTNRRLLYLEGIINKTKTIVWYVDGNVKTGTEQSARVKINFSGAICKVIVHAKTAPTGANLILDINQNGTSIWSTTQANRAKIVAGSNDGSQTNFDTTAISEDDYFTLDIDQIGSGTSGANLTVELIIENVDDD